MLIWPCRGTIQMIAGWIQLNHSSRASLPNFAPAYPANLTAARPQVKIPATRQRYYKRRNELSTSFFQSCKYWWTNIRFHENSIQEIKSSIRLYSIRTVNQRGNHGSWLDITMPKPRRKILGRTAWPTRTAGTMNGLMRWIWKFWTKPKLGKWCDFWRKASSTRTWSIS